MGKTKIEWTGKNGYTWNPVVGCSKISPGCAHCYAETMAIRLATINIILGFMAMEKKKSTRLMVWNTANFRRKYD